MSARRTPSVFFRFQAAARFFCLLGVFLLPSHAQQPPSDEKPPEAKPATEKPEELFRCPIPRAPLYITVPAKVGTEDVVLVFDACAAMTALDPSFRGLAVRKLQNPAPAGDPGKEVKLVELPDIALQDFVIHQPTGSFLDMQMLQQFVGDSVSGVLGISDLGDAKVLLDYDANVLEFHRGPWKLTAADTQEVDFAFDHGAPKFDSTIEGHPGAFFIDSGLNGCLGIESALFDKLVTEGVIEVDPQTGRNAGAGGIATNKQGWFLKGSFMGRDLQGASVAVTSGRNLLGLGWLCGFQSEFDVAAHKFRYRSLPHARPPVEMSLMLGAIVIFDNGRAEFEGFQPNGRGLLERSGVLPTEVIEEFGDLGFHKLNASRLVDALVAQAGQKVNLKLYNPRDLSRRELTIELPPVVSSWDFAGKVKEEKSPEPEPASPSVPK